MKHQGDTLRCQGSRQQSATLRSLILERTMGNMVKRWVDTRMSPCNSKIRQVLASQGLLVMGNKSENALHSCSQTARRRLQSQTIGKELPKVTLKHQSLLLG